MLKNAYCPSIRSNVVSRDDDVVGFKIKKGGGAHLGMELVGIYQKLFMSVIR